ncbi:MAG: hypothetical protein COB66_03100 [Coxiella sp. (in: Bacteria)]|nr:MAG: hypothetical protein COB66_03100 [Coxiella sp. (in: g-proteobacteria)]
MMRRRNWLGLLFFVFFSITACAQKPLITAFYYPGARRLTTLDLSLNKGAISHLDVLIYSASVQGLRPNGRHYSLPNVTRYNLHFIAQWLRKQKMQTKLILSLGYWNPAAMRHTITRPADRQRFVSSIINTLQNRYYGLDGIDIDWENVYGPVSHEITRFPLFIRALNQAMKQHGLQHDLLTLDIPSNFIAKFPAPSQWAPYVNWANLMGYEFYGDTLTYTELDGAFGNVTVRYNGKPPRYPIIALVTSLKQYQQLGLPPNKLVVVLRDYAFSNHVRSTSRLFYAGLHQRIIGRHDVTVYPYWKLVLMAGTYGHTKHGYQAHRYRFKTPAAAKGFSAYWMTKGHRFISYPDPIAIKEITHYLVAQHYRGISIWELSDALKFHNSASLLSIIVNAAQ